MKKTIAILAVLALSAGIVISGSSGVTNPIKKMTPQGSAHRDAAAEFGDDVVTELDSDEDRLDAIEAGTKELATLNVAGASILSGSLEQDMVVITDTNAYAILDANSGKIHFIPDLTADSTNTLPAEATGLHYKFVYNGGAADAQDWIITTGNDTNYFVGGLVQLDPGAATSNSVAINYYSNGSSNSKLTVLTPEAGTFVEIWCDTGVTWRVSGMVVSDTDTGVVFANQ